MKQTLLLILSLIACTVTAQTDLKPAPEGMTADEIMAQYVAQTGGDTYDKQESLIMKATMVLEAQNLQADVTVYAKEPNKIMVHQNIANMMEIKQGYDGKIGWESNPITGLRELSGQELENLKLTATFNYQAKWEEVFTKRELLGVQEVTGKPAYVLRMTPEKASPMTYFIDTETYQLVRSDSTQISAMGEMTTQSYFSDFKDIEGLSTPMKITQKTPMGAAIMTINEVNLNVTIDDAVFTKPEPPPATAPTPN